MSSSIPWRTLPAEMKLAIIDLLHLTDVKSLAKVDRQAYLLSVPTLFRSVDLSSYEALQSYLSNVPPSYHNYIHQLSICTSSRSDGRVPAKSSHSSTSVTEAVIDLLDHCTQLERLTLKLDGSLRKSVIPCFTTLCSLTSLSIHHVGDERATPLSERLVVSIAASLPALEQLSLDRIARSIMHAPELVGVPPYVPLVAGDDDIPEHPLLGHALQLPSLLRIPTLKKLRIRDTHLGDPQWSCTPVCCALEVLDLGSCCLESLDYNRICTERIMGNVGHTVGECALNTALTAQTFEFAKHKEKPLKQLRKIHLTPLFPVENVVDTLTTLSASPVEKLSVQCHEDDVEDMCSALEDFLNLRVERGEKAFYEHLNEIVVDAVSDLDDYYLPAFETATHTPSSKTLSTEHAEAVQRLQEFCRDLRHSRTDSRTDGVCRPDTGVAGTDTEKTSCTEVPKAMAL